MRMADCDWVEQAATRGVFAGGVLSQIGGAFNIFRINTYSEESGITRVNSAGVPKVGQKRNTALGFQYSGQWDRCWIAPPVPADPRPWRLRLP